MGFWKRIFRANREGNVRQKETAKGYFLVIGGPQFGPIGGAQLRHITEGAALCLRARYGNSIRKIERSFDLEKGSTFLLVDTESITAKQAQEISAFGLKCLQGQQK